MACSAMFWYPVSATAVDNQLQFSAEEVKSAYLLNFGKFVDWPATILSNRTANFKICIIGPDPLREKLELMLRDQKIKERQPEILRISLPTAFTCHIAYITSNDPRKVTETLKHLKTVPTLTVSDFPEFTEVGGMIQFKPEREHLRFKINLTAAQRAGLQISSKLLQIAEVVRQAAP